jgi:hypothetical protein
MSATWHKEMSIVETNEIMKTAAHRSESWCWRQLLSLVSCLDACLDVVGVRPPIYTGTTFISKNSKESSYHISPQNWVLMCLLSSMTVTYLEFESHKLVTRSDVVGGTVYFGSDVSVTVAGQTNIEPLVPVNTVHPQRKPPYFHRLLRPIVTTASYSQTQK